MMIALSFPFETGRISTPPRRTIEDRRLSEIAIRVEQPSDAPAVAALLEEAFVGPTERDLVARLRDEGSLGLCLLAEDPAEGLLGMVAFPPLVLEGAVGVAPKAVALAPLAVRPDAQRRGLGSRLVREGLARWRADDVALAIVLGEPVYYARFGFSVAAARNLISPYAGPYFMALALQPEGVSGSWRVVYPAPFAALG